MSALVPLTGAPLTAEGEFIRLALGLEAAHRTKKIKLSADGSVADEPVVSYSIANFPNQATQKQRITIVAYIPLPDNYTELSGKPWANIAELGTEVIPATFGTR